MSKNTHYATVGMDKTITKAKVRKTFLKTSKSKKVMSRMVFNGLSDFS